MSDHIEDVVMNDSLFAYAAGVCSFEACCVVAAFGVDRTTALTDASGMIMHLRSFWARAERLQGGTPEARMTALNDFHMFALTCIWASTKIPQSAVRIGSAALMSGDVDLTLVELGLDPNECVDYAQISSEVRAICVSQLSDVIDELANVAAMQNLYFDGA